MLNAIDEARDERWMQSVAAEMNLSETAFLLAQDDGYRLRWFTPAVEVRLCGHATLASAHVLWSEAYVPEHEILSFDTASGVLQAKLAGEAIELDFPARLGREIAPPVGLEAAAGAVGQTHHIHAGGSLIA